MEETVLVINGSNCCIKVTLLKSCTSRERSRHLKEFSRRFLVQAARQHRDVLDGMGLENFCKEPCFSNLRNNMRTLVEVLATVAAGLPQQQHYGFYRSETITCFYCAHCEEDGTVSLLVCHFNSSPSSD